MGKQKAPGGKQKASTHVPTGVKKHAQKKAPEPKAGEAKPGISRNAGTFLKARQAGGKVKGMHQKLLQRSEELEAAAEIGGGSHPMQACQKVTGMQKSFLQQRSEAKSNSACSLEGLVELANNRNGTFDRQQESMPGVDPFAATWQMNGRGHGEADNNRRRFYSELRKVLFAADIVIEVLDARDPGSCRCIDLENEVTRAGKRIILLLNKIDLVPKHAVEAWVKHLKRSFPTIPFKCARGGARPTHAMTKASTAPEGLLQSSHGVIGADELMQLLKNYARSAIGKMAVTVGIVGYPNTGKSSVINSMKRMPSVEVGGKAGMTKIMQEVKLDSKVTLLDCPGIVFAGASNDPGVILRNVVRPERVKNPEQVVDALVEKVPRDKLLEFYGMEKDFSHAHELLVYIAQTRGKLLRGSGLDIPSAARLVITDWTIGKFRYFVMPEETAAMGEADLATKETAEVVTALAPKFDIDALISGQGAFTGGFKPVVHGGLRPAGDDDMGAGPAPTGGAVAAANAAFGPRSVEVDM